jgi:hypothetical protein
MSARDMAGDCAMTDRFLKISLCVCALVLLGTSPLRADCAYGAKSKTQFQILDSNTILLTGGYGGQIVVKIYCCVMQSSNVTVLKDDFCSYESSVLYIDGNVIDVRDVKKID